MVVLHRMVTSASTAHALRIVLATLPRVGRSYELFPGKFDVRRHTHRHQQVKTTLRIASPCVLQKMRFLFRGMGGDETGSWREFDDSLLALLPQARG